MKKEEEEGRKNEKLVKITITVTIKHFSNNAENMSQRTGKNNAQTSKKLVIETNVSAF